MNEPFDGRTGFDWNAPLPNTTSGLFQWIADCYSAELKIHNPVQFNEWQMDRINKARDKLAVLTRMGVNTSKPFDWRSPLPDTIGGLQRWLSDFETDHMHGPSGGFKIASDEAEKWKKAADATAKLKDLHQMRDMAVSDEHLMNLLRGPVAMNWTSLTGLVARIIVSIRARGMKPLPDGFAAEAATYFMRWNLLRVQGHIMHPGGGVFTREGAVPTLEYAVNTIYGRELSQEEGTQQNRDPLKESTEWNKQVSDFLDTMKTVVVRKDGK